MTKTCLASLTYKEVKEAVKRNPVVLIPLGSEEEHGPQTPMGDYRLAEHVAMRLGGATDSLVTPVIPFGYSEYFKNFPGTITFAHSTMFSVLYDILSSLIRTGFSNLLVVNGHGGNTPIVEHVARKVREDFGILIGCVSPWRCFSKAFLKEVYGVDNPIGHGSEPMTSMSLALFPEEVNLEDGEEDQSKDVTPFVVKGITTLGMGDADLTLYANMEDITPNGVTGDVGLASAERGRRILDHVVEVLTPVVKAFPAAKTTLEDPVE